MRFTPMKIAGAYAISLDRREDERGFFARAFCMKEFADHGLHWFYPQINMSVSDKCDTLRGLHYQEAPFAEAKLIRCVRGILWDVVLDLRPQSATFGQWQGMILDEYAREAIYVPEGCAHGFLTMDDNTEALYLVSHSYVAGAERGVRWNDPRFAIKWPDPPAVMSDKDRNWPDYAP